jgi:hypothetical protein
MKTDQMSKCQGKEKLHTCKDTIKKQSKLESKYMGTFKQNKCHGKEKLPRIERLYTWYATSAWQIDHNCIIKMIYIQRSNVF